MKAALDVATRYLGFCAICEKDIKLQDGKFVHHGYKRPGDGRIHGDCHCVFREPYERSCEPLREYAAVVDANLSHHRALLKKLESGTVTFFIRNNWQKEPVQYALGVTDWYTFKSALESRVHDVRWIVKCEERELARIQKWIDNWQLKEVRTIEEKVAEQRAAADVRKAEREAARKAKQAKRDALDAKRAALEAKRAAIKEELAIEALKLADRKDAGENVTKDVEKFWRRVLSQRSWHMYPDAIKSDTALVKLGLAWTSNGYVNYRQW